jgi:hypothetical protein
MSSRDVFSIFMLFMAVWSIFVSLGASKSENYPLTKANWMITCGLAHFGEKPTEYFIDDTRLQQARTAAREKADKEESFGFNYSFNANKFKSPDGLFIANSYQATLKAVLVGAVFIFILALFVKQMSPIAMAFFILLFAMNGCISMLTRITPPIIQEFKDPFKCDNTNFLDGQNTILKAPGDEK